MLALIAGRGVLPETIIAAQPTRPLVCAMRGQHLDSVTCDIEFRLERLGGFMRDLKKRGVTQVCFCGAVDRPAVSLRSFDLPTLMLIPRIVKGLRGGEDSALRLAVTTFESQGFSVVGAHELVPDLLAGPQVLAGILPDGIEALAKLGDAVNIEQSAADLGQSCVLRDGTVLAREPAEGTDHMLANLDGAEGGVFYKACKPDQDRRVDMPVIGPSTVYGAAKAGLTGLIIEANSVMLLDREAIFQALTETGLFLWSRSKSSDTSPSAI